MNKVKFTFLGKTKFVPHRTFTNGKEDNPPKEKWHDNMWVETGEDWFGLDFYKREGKTVLVVTREDWLRSEEI